MQYSIFRGPEIWPLQQINQLPILGPVVSFVPIQPLIPIARALLHSVINKGIAAFGDNRPSVLIV